ncbi:MAG: pseudouridine synthase, partial [Lachnospiraceae bacterium]|nr:pseudouridine synthase [Lachnospiraceae bacterium]
VGYISSTVRQTPGDRLVTELVSDREGARLFPMGRLDKDSEGLILLTDDGELMDRVLRSRYGHEKEYRVGLDCTITDDIIKEIAAGGIDIGEERRTKPCKVKRLAPDRVSIILTEGMNREIRRIFEIYDMGVSSLCRVRFLNITLDGLRPGESRRLTEDEIKKMKEGAFLKEGL